MRTQIIEYTKIASYFLWEYTNYDNPLCHWYCSEDIACVLEKMGILTFEQIAEFKKMSKYDFAYIEFIRKIAFMIFTYTNIKDNVANWFYAERLISTNEWCDAITKMSSIYSREKESLEFISKLRSEKVRVYYQSLL